MDKYIKTHKWIFVIFSVVLTCGITQFWPLPVFMVCSCAETRHISSCIKKVAWTATYFLQLWKLSFIVDICDHTNKRRLSFLYYLSLASSEEMHSDLSCSLLHLLVRFVAKTWCLTCNALFLWKQTLYADSSRSLGVESRTATANHAAIQGIGDSSDSAP